MHPAYPESLKPVDCEDVEEDAAEAVEIRGGNTSITALQLADGQDVVLNYSITARWSTFRCPDETFLLFDDDHLRDQVNKFRKGYSVHETEVLI
ncbi:hypothetical protein LTR51_008672 [Lithohypha guttulata]|nr:hypothetical protein LTR51_008672 [Lithohypha guttulata]